MKPNDKAIEAARAEGKRWQELLIRRENQIPCWKVLREADDGYDDVIAKFNSREERDKALERLRAEAMLTAAYAAQFPPSGDYAGLIKQLRQNSLFTDSVNEELLFLSAADALEALLAERDDFAEQLALRSESGMAKDMQEIMCINNELVAERDALAARLAPVEDEALVEIVAVYCSPEMNWNEMSEKWKNSCRRDARAAIDAIRPHIEAVERERCAKKLDEACELLHKLTAIIPGNDGAGEEVAKFLRSATIRSGR